jgi:hypothetical protein
VSGTDENESPRERLAIIENYELRKVKGTFVLPLGPLARQLYPSNAPELGSVDSRSQILNRSRVRLSLQCRGPFT